MTEGGNWGLGLTSVDRHTVDCDVLSLQLNQVLLRYLQWASSLPSAPLGRHAWSQLEPGQHQACNSLTTSRSGVQVPRLEMPQELPAASQRVFNVLTLTAPDTPRGKVPA